MQILVTIVVAVLAVGSTLSAARKRKTDHR
jgi:hypothetical protein